MALVKSHRELRVWQNAMDVAMEIFHMSKHFPIEERYNLTDQVRRSSRSVAANISEAWRKRRYVAAFRSKLNDAETEAAESQTHIEIARRCRYIEDATACEVDVKYEGVLNQLSVMIRDGDTWCKGISNQ